uniref:ORF40d n=1 Tax=Pinus thunbergii TaxID=3350 RepID=Q32971_PINTH|nr:ORF40d [Pinus thunbergii]
MPRSSLRNGAFFSSVTESISLVSIDPKLFLLHKLNSFNLA